MKKASEIYESDFYWTNYQPMLNEFGTILLQVDEKTWQGDSWLVYQKDNKFGYLSFGWGHAVAVMPCKRAILLKKYRS